MKLATLKDGSRDGRLVVVSRDLSRAVAADNIAATMQFAIENWAAVKPKLEVLSGELNAGRMQGSFAFNPAEAMAPLPRAYQWLDGSAFLNHGKLMQKAFNLDPIDGADTTPLMYQGAGDDFLGGRDDIPLPSESLGIDFEGEFGVLVDEVPMGCPAEQAAAHIKLILQINDVSLRALAPREMKTGFGFIQAKSSSSFAAVAITPDELGDAWRDERVQLPLQLSWNSEWFGNPNGSEMNFSFAQLIAHAALTRKLGAGTLIGSGTLSNADLRAGSACIAERRAIEMIQQGAPQTGFMRFGDRVQMDVFGVDGQSLFGGIDQQIVAAC
ncbi:fumarylacetoacetate hydrolase family protein [Pseudomonas sp. PCH199]|uniref:fumarylacetoacetate hydrolase family protein n=1 Tax=unclassified Pseudomonas TaxID=196821 RepID=UPI000BDBBAE6|nr:MULTISPECIES: fumarylacetoacetate hydrolase family protein [unclassified Pseudomonas]MCW8277867.1 fumarylacetoacetate hydrolase family protein [Pseudomonas sp. PCH199]PAM82026.1 fumarylacetoacetate hydrolase [Pseudomonas sp. ERMR1:02]